jgi:hypothetical protein
MMPLRKLSVTFLVLGMTCAMTSIAVAQGAPDAGGANLKTWDTE